MCLQNRRVIALLETPDLAKNNGYRDRTMLELLYATGMRVTEIIQLDVEDVNLMMGFVRECSGKGTRKELSLRRYRHRIFNYVYRNRKTSITQTNHNPSAIP